jgi:uncharacterized membrane protein YbhN (UPF0104 family)
MLVPTWILAIATAILALSVPVAWFTWWTGRRRDKEQQQREREDKARADLIREAGEKFVSKDTAGGVMAVGVIAAVLFVAGWLDARKPK